MNIFRALVRLYFNRSRGRYYADCDWPKIGDHKRVRKYVSLETSDPEEAEEALEEFKEVALPGLELEVTQQRLGLIKETPDGSIAALVDWFVNVHLPYLGRAEGTIRSYRLYLNDFRAFAADQGVTRIEKVTVPLVQHWQKHRADTATSHRFEGTRPAEISAIKHWMNECAEAYPNEGFTVPNLRIKIPKRGRSTRFKVRSLDEQRALFEKLHKHGPDLVNEMLWTALTGWTIGDVLDLRESECSLEEGEIDRIRKKTGNALPWPITPAMRAILDGQRARKRAAAIINEFVFFNPEKARPWTYLAFKKRLERFCAKHIGYNVNPRDFRKSFVTLQIKMGADPNTARELLGGRSLAVVLNNYDEVDFDRMEKAARRYQSALLKTTEHGKRLANVPRRRRAAKKRRNG